MSISRNPAYDGGQSYKIFSAGMVLWVVAVIALALSGATI